MIEALSRGYHIPVIDYGRKTSGLLISSGCGCMMAAMDACPSLRWCLDIDALKPISNFPAWLLWMDRLCDPIAVLGWFSITDPAPLRRALERVPRLARVVVYTQCTALPGGIQCANMGQFVEALEI